MSGVLTALETIGALFGGYGIVTLGPVVFQGQEVPEKIGIGGAQSLKVHKLPGGLRVIDAMGRDDRSLSWSGIMLGVGAEQRMLLLDSLRVSGQEITLAFGTMSYTVVVSEFTGDYRRTNWCEYSISCEVLVDNSAQFASVLPTDLQQITSDIGSALGYIPSDLPGIASVVGSAQTALAVTGAISQGSAAFTAATAAVGSAVSSVSNGISSAGASIATLASGAAGILGTDSGFAATGAAIANMATAVTSSGDVAGLVTAGGYLGRVATNLANAGA
jgi:prophage DNA circulation protein